MSATAARPVPEPVIDPQQRVDLVLAELRTRTAGLSAREAARRLTQYGPNAIVRRTGPQWPAELLRQFAHPLALLLWVAAGLSLLSGDLTLALAIVAVIGLNAALAFAQERQAERATEALRHLLPLQVTVRRDGEEQQLDAEQLVPGDILLVGEGDRLSADARLISGELELDIAALTGESRPVQRAAIPSGRAASILEADDLVFAGTSCTSGDAEAVIFATGMSTQLGRIAALSQRVEPEISPLQQQVNRVAWLIAAIGVGVGAIFFAAGISLAGLSLAAAVTFAVGLLVANVPEGLLPTITLSLAGGVRRMAARRALVKRLTAVETLGSTDVICTDKTGTLTEGRMSVRLWWTLAGELGGADGAVSRPELAELLDTAVACNNARLEREDGTWRRIGDPTESALLAGAEAAGYEVLEALQVRHERRARAYAFDSRVKRMTTLDRDAQGALAYHVKGAPGELLACCTSVRNGEDRRPLTADEHAQITVAIDRYASAGLRVLGFATRPAPSDDGEDRATAESDLTFLGLAALVDPPRPEVADAVAQCHRAGIRIIVITGDDGRTAEAIAREVGIVTGRAKVVTGPQLDAMPEGELDHLLRSEAELVIARSNPESKLHVVDALRAEGHTVAMTGDGVNDAPALRRADIGVAMGASGTDVAREAATMVLTDDNFASIVAAVQEGRVVYDDIRKFITYIFVHAIPEIAPFALFALTGGAIPLPLTPLQVLAIDLGTDTVPALALGREPAEPGIMDRPPRPRQSGIISGSMLARAWLRLGALEALLVLGGFFFVMLTGGWRSGVATGAGSALHHLYRQATTMTWAGIVTCQMGAAFAVRSTSESTRRIGLFTNPHLLRGVAFALAFAALIIYAPPLQTVFRTAALGPRDVAILIAFAPTVWASDELWRWARRRRSDAAQAT